MDVYYLVVNGRQMPTPYFTWQEAQNARDELIKNSVALSVNVIHKSEW